MHGDIDFPVSRSLNSNPNHGDDHGSNNRNEACNGHVAHFMQSPRQCKNQTDDESHESENDGASSVIGDGIHHDGEGQDVTTHDKDQEKDLSRPEDFATYWTCHDFASVGHIVYMRICKFKLANDVASIGCENAEACDESDTTV